MLNPVSTTQFDVEDFAVLLDGESLIPEILSFDRLHTLLDKLSQLHPILIFNHPSKCGGDGQLRKHIRVDISDSFNSAVYCREVAAHQYHILIPIGVAFRSYVLARLLMRYWPRIDPLSSSSPSTDQRRVPDALRVLFHDCIDEEEFKRQLIALNSAIAPNDPADVDALQLTAHVLFFCYLHEHAHVRFNHRAILKDVDAHCQLTPQVIQKRQDRLEKESNDHRARFLQIREQFTSIESLLASGAGKDYIYAVTACEELWQIRNDWPQTPRDWSSTAFHRAIEYSADAFASMLLTRIPAHLDPHIDCMQKTYAIFMWFGMRYLTHMEVSNRTSDDAYGHPVWRLYMAINTAGNMLKTQPDGFASTFAVWNDARMLALSKAVDAFRYLSVDFAGTADVLLAAMATPTKMTEWPAWIRRYEREIDICRFTDELLESSGVLGSAEGDRALFI